MISGTLTARNGTRVRFRINAQVHPVSGHLAYPDPSDRPSRDTYDFTYDTFTFRLDSGTQFHEVGIEESDSPDMNVDFQVDPSEIELVNKWAVEIAAKKLNKAMPKNTQAPKLRSRV